MAWFEAHQELPRHPKTRKAAKRLGIPIPHLVGHMWCLWGWALDMADDGNLSKFDAEDIAIGAEWEGDPQDFVDALTDCGSAGGAGFLERGGSYGPDDHQTAGELVLHGWWDRAGKLVAKRRRDALRKRKERADVPADSQDIPPVSSGRPADSPADVPVTSSDGATHTTRPTEHNTTKPLGGADALALDTLPVKPADEQTYSRTLAAWGERHDHPPEAEDRNALTRWLVQLLERHAPNHGIDRKAARGLARMVIVDYLTATTHTEAPAAMWGYLGRLIETSGAGPILESVVVAVESGAGLDPKHADDPLALLKYATAVKNGKGRPA